MATKTLKKIKSTPAEKDRKRAFEEMCPLILSYEKVSEKTIYQKIFFDKKRAAWRYIGRAHDYSWSVKQ